jgi:hypothetical protein
MAGCEDLVSQEGSQGVEVKMDSLVEKPIAFRTVHQGKDEQTDEQC